MSRNFHGSECGFSHSRYEPTPEELKDTKASLQAVCADCEKRDVYSGKKWWGCPNCEYWRLLLEVLQKIQEW